MKRFLGCMSATVASLRFARSSSESKTEEESIGEAIAAFVAMLLAIVASFFLLAMVSV